MVLFTTIASYAIGVILILLLTFGQDIAPQYEHWIHDAILACGAFLLFLSDPKAFLAHLRDMSSPLTPIPATLQPIPGISGVAQVNPIDKTGKVEPPPLVVPTIPAGEVHPDAPVAPVVPTDRVG